MTALKPYVFISKENFNDFLTKQKVRIEALE